MRTKQIAGDCYKYPVNSKLLQKQFKYLKAILNNLFNEVVMNTDYGEVKYFEDLIETCNDFINDYEYLLKGGRL